MAENWMSLPEAAQLLARGYNVVYRLVLTGELRSQRQGARLFVHRGDVLRFVRRWREGERAEAATR